MSTQPRKPAGSTGSTGGQFAPQRAGEAEVALDNTPTFEFRGLSDYSTVEPFYDKYLSVYEEVTAGGQFPYNDLFKGKIAGIAWHPREDAAIHMLQTLRARKETQALVDSFEAEGAVNVDDGTKLDGFVPVASVAESGFYVGGHGFRRYEGGRVGRTATGNLIYLPPGHSRNGQYLGGRVQAIFKGRK